jgi:hypothetical protein
MWLPACTAPDDLSNGPARPRWERMGWDGVGWDVMGWDRMGWDCDEGWVGWDEMGLDRTRWFDGMRPPARPPAPVFVCLLAWSAL